MEESNLTAPPLLNGVGANRSESAPSGGARGRNRQPGHGSRGSRRQVAVDRQDPARGLRRLKLGSVPASGRLPQALAQRRVVGQPHDGPSQALGIAFGYDEAGFPI